MQRGEVRWYRFQEPDKRRPVIILTRQPALEFLGEVTIAPTTTRIREIPSEVVLSVEDGMPKECAVNLDHVQTIPKGKLGSLITRLGPRKLEEVEDALLFALGIRRSRL